VLGSFRELHAVPANLTVLKLETCQDDIKLLTTSYVGIPKFNLVKDNL